MAANLNPDNCVFCCLHSRLHPDPTQHRLDDPRVFVFRGDGLTRPTSINYGGNPNIVIRRPITYYIDVAIETRANPTDHFEEVSSATYVLGTIIQPGEDGYREPSDFLVDGDQGIQTIDHDEVVDLEARAVLSPRVFEQELERGWVQIIRQVEGFNPHLHAYWHGTWIGVVWDSGLICSSHGAGEYRILLYLICPRRDAILNPEPPEF